MSAALRSSGGGGDRIGQLLRVLILDIGKLNHGGARRASVGLLGWGFWKLVIGKVKKTILGVNG